MEDPNRIKLICIKSYMDEDDAEQLEAGVLEECDARVYEVGEEHYGHIWFNEEYWKEAEDK